LPYSTITYQNGPGFADHYVEENDGLRIWQDPSTLEYEGKDYRQPSSLLLQDDTHGGEDVGIFAIGKIYLEFKITGTGGNS